MALSLGLGCKWSVGRERHKAGGDATFPFPRELGFPPQVDGTTCPWMQGKNGVGLQAQSVSKLLLGFCSWPGLQLLLVWLCQDTVGIHRSPATKHHSSQDNTYLRYMLSPTKGWFLVQAPTSGCIYTSVLNQGCSRWGVGALWYPAQLVGLQGWRQAGGRKRAASGERSRSKPRQYCAKAQKELVLTCRNHTVPCGHLAVGLPLCYT